MINQNNCNSASRKRLIPAGVATDARTGLPLRSAGQIRHKSATAKNMALQKACIAVTHLRENTRPKVHIVEFSTLFRTQPSR
jgi:hypothetical protein